MSEPCELFQNILVLLFLWCENAVGKMLLGLGKKENCLGLGKVNGLV